MSKFFNECKEKYRGSEIAIIGNGPSMMRCVGNSREFGVITSADPIKCPIWTVNGGWHHWKSELAFAIDDLRWGRSIMDERGHIDFWNQLFRDSKIPIVTSIAYPDISPTSVAFPLRECLQKIPFRLYHETIHYMLALAIACGVKKIQIHGCDYTASERYPWERAGTEAWIMAASLKGIEVAISEKSNLLKMQREEPNEIEFFDPEYYGYKKDSVMLQSIRSIADTRERKYA